MTDYYWKFETIDNFGAKTSSEIFSFKLDNAINASRCSGQNNTSDDTLGADNSSNTKIKQVVQSLSAQIWYKGFLQPLDNESYGATIEQILDSKPNENVTA